MHKLSTKITLGQIAKYRLFSESSFTSALYYTISEDLSLLPTSIQSSRLLLTIDGAYSATEEELENFKNGISYLRPSPVHIFFKTQAKPVQIEGLPANFLRWKEEKVLVDIMAYSRDYGDNVIIPEQNPIVDFQHRIK